MVEVHAPQEIIHTWRSFFIHITTIVIGLFIAIGLEQTLEFFHHRDQRAHLEEQMREVFEDDIKLVAGDLEQLKAFRAYLVDLQMAVIARRQGQSRPGAPAGNDPRSATFVRFPSLAAYEAAKDNGTVALLPGERIRLYNRIALQRSLLMTVIDLWDEDLMAMNAFIKRFEPSSEGVGFGQALPAVDLTVLSPAELTEYQVLISNLANRTDYVRMRLQFFDAQCRAILGGARDEHELIKAMLESAKSGP